MKVSDWATAFTLLMSFGHTFEGILDYSYGQFKYFVEAADRARRLQDLRMFRSTILAMGGKPGQIREYLDELTDGT
jgi:hypothetical protein